MIFYEQKSIVTCLTTGWSPLLSNGATEQAIRMISALRQGSWPPLPAHKPEKMNWLPRIAMNQSNGTFSIQNWSAVATHNPNDLKIKHNDYKHLTCAIG